MPRPLLVVGLLGSLMACDSSGTVHPGTGSAVVRADVMDSRVVDAEVSIDVRVRVENRGLIPLDYFPCATTLARQEGSAWSGVWSRLCNSDYALTVAAGAILEDTLRIRSRRESGGSVWPNGSITGDYRATVAVAAGRVLLAGAERTSNTFPLAER